VERLRQKRGRSRLGPAGNHGTGMRVVSENFVLAVLVIFIAVTALVVIDRVLDRQDITKIERASMVGARSSIYGILLS
jgi:hypothetical protein